MMDEIRRPLHMARLSEGHIIARWLVGARRVERKSQCGRQTRDPA